MYFVRSNTQINRVIKNIFLQLEVRMFLNINNNVNLTMEIVVPCIHVYSLYMLCLYRSHTIQIWRSNPKLLDRWPSGRPFASSVEGQRPKTIKLTTVASLDNVHHLRATTWQIGPISV